MELSVHPRSLTGEKVLYVGSSISYHCDFDVLRNETGAEVVTRKAYSTVFDQNARFPDKNFTTVLHREVSVHQPALVIVQTSSVDITLIREKSLSWPDAVNAAKRSSFDILCLAWSLCDNPNIQQIILSKRTPRIDCPLRKQLTEIANDELTRLHSLYRQSSAKIHIGAHNLQFSSPTQTAALFGARGNGRYDGWHLYGNQGVRRYTDSVLNILCEAGVALKSSTKASLPAVTPAFTPVKSSAPEPDYSTALQCRGGKGEDIGTMIANIAITAAATNPGYEIGLHHVIPNLANGDCSFESVTDQLNNSRNSVTNRDFATCGAGRLE